MLLCQSLLIMLKIMPAEFANGYSHLQMQIQRWVQKNQHQHIAIKFNSEESVLAENSLLIATEHGVLSFVLGCGL